MDIKTTTKFFVLAVLIIILGWDAYREITVGFEGTISYFLYHLGSDYPIVPLLLGIVIGHLFWNIKEYENPHI